MKNRLLLLIAIVLSVASTHVNAGEQNFINADIEGIFCPFCVNLLIVDLGDLPEVEEVRVSVDHKKLLIVLKPDKKPNQDKIKDIIRKAGFVPIKIDVTTTKNTAVAKAKQPLLGNVHVDIKSQSCSNCHSK